jgi:hypothetical protein
MTTQELIAAIRIRLDDTIVPYLASTATILEQLSLTQIEFARSTLVLFNAAAVSITAANPWLTLPTDMFLVKVAILNGLQLRAITSSELDFGYYTFNSIENEGRFSNWREATGTPKFVVVDMYSDKVRLVPTPISNATVNVEGFITPPDVFFDETPGSVVPAVNPQIPEIYHEVLMAGALSRLYTLFEVEILNPSKAQLYAAQWQQGLVEAQNILQTPLRRQIRLMELSRGFSYLNPMTEQKV